MRSCRSRGWDWRKYRPGRHRLMAKAWRGFIGATILRLTSRSWRSTANCKFAGRGSSPRILLPRLSTSSSSLGMHFGLHAARTGRCPDSSSARWGPGACASGGSDPFAVAEGGACATVQRNRPNQRARPTSRAKGILDSQNSPRASRSAGRYGGQKKTDPTAPIAVRKPRAGHLHARFVESTPDWSASPPEKAVGSTNFHDTCVSCAWLTSRRLRGPLAHWCGGHG